MKPAAALLFFYAETEEQRRWWWWRKIWEFLAIFNNGFMPGSQAVRCCYCYSFARELKLQAYYFVNPLLSADVFKLQFSCYLMKDQVKLLLNKHRKALMNKGCLAAPSAGIGASHKKGSLLLKLCCSENFLNSTLESVCSSSSSGWWWRTKK